MLRAYEEVAPLVQSPHALRVKDREAPDPLITVSTRTAGRAHIEQADMQQSQGCSR